MKTDPTTGARTEPDEDTALLSGPGPQGEDWETGPGNNPRVGERWSHYMLLRRIGEGGMGVVFSAYDEDLDRRVAIKFLHERLGQDPSGRARLRREAQAMARLSDPHVVTVHEVGEHGGRVYITMELVQGQTLREWLGQGHAWPVVLEHFVAAGQGLAAAHATGLVHRDFKPANVLVSNDGRVRVTDFGIARASTTGAVDERGIDDLPSELVGDRTDALSSPLTQTGTVQGTPAYMAPEQMLGESADPRADQFSFCVALWEGLYGLRPHQADDVRELGRAKHKGEIVEPPPDSAVPRWIEVVLRRGLSPEPDDRFVSLPELLDALTHDPTRARRRWIGLGVAVAVGVGVGGLWALGEYRARQACDTEGREIDASWDSSTRSRIHDAITGTDLPYAEDTWQRTEVRLDAFAEQWAQARRSACLAHDVESTRSADLDAASRDCLEDARDGLDALLDVLAAGDGMAVQHAVAAVASLRPPAGCMDDSLLPRGRAGERTERAATRPLRIELARADARADAGDYARAQVMVDQVLEAASSIDAPRLVIRAQLLSAHLGRRRGELEPARDANERAYFDAVRVGDERLIALAAVDLLYVEGYLQTNKDAGLRWGKMASAIFDRLALHDRPPALSLYQAMGATLLVFGDIDGAAEWFERQWSVTQEYFGEQSPQGLTALTSRANIAYQRGDFDRAQELYERGVELTERLFGPQHPDMVSALTHVGLVHEARGELPQARAIGERAVALARSLLDRDNSQRLSAENNLGRVYEQQGEFDEALALYEGVRDSWERTRGPRHPDVAGALLNIANLHYRRGEFDEALALHRKTLEIFQATFGENHRVTASSQHNIGAVYEAKGEHSTAIEYFERAATAWEAALGPEHHQVANALFGWGLNLYKAGRPADAIAPLERADHLWTGFSGAGIHLPTARWILARALWESGGDRGRAFELTQLAQEGFASAGPEGRSWLEEIDDWRSTHSAPGGAEASAPAR